MTSMQSKSSSHFFKKYANPELMAVLGGVLFLIQAVIFAHTRLPNMDEGSYLVKGYLYAQGVYQPFQPYAFWMNKMYMSFLPWGWLQTLTHPGLLAPRMFTILLNLLSLFGVWIVTRRMGNRWLATGAVWVMALNSSLISIYSLANSQVLIACILTWVLVLTLGDKRPTWQIGLGLALAGLMILTRENMVFVLPFLVIYIFWQNGWKTGLISFSSLAFVVVIGHLVYWPEVMTLWLRWIPVDLFQASPVSNATTITTSTGLGFVSKLHSLSMAIRVHYIALTGSILLFCLWPKKEGWQTRSQFRAAVFLGITYFVLLASHTWAALTSRACTYCTTNYFAFFHIVGILFVVILIQNLNPRPGALSATAIIITILASITAVWFSLFEQVGATLLLLPIPRMRYNQLISGWATLWDILNNKFQIVYQDARMFVPAGFGVLFGIILVVVLRLVYKRLAHLLRVKSIPFTHLLVYACLAISLILAPLTTRPYGELICRSDVIAPFEELGAQLRELAPPGSKIFLDGTRASVLLLYTPDLIILPPQLNDIYSIKEGPDSDSYLRRGLMNQAIADQWRDQADVLVIEDSRFEAWRNYFKPDQFDEVILSLESSNCPTNTVYHFFTRK
jgi:hypothetical protein